MTRRWLSLKQAQAYTGFGKEKILSMVGSGHFVGRKAGDSPNSPWRIDIESIDKYFNDYEARALDILASLPV